ncbi:MAG: hypothetical protein Q4D51_10345 [Eubacteriales bacterium]|nr:hypothetical protein [Eubacteriales bacterium]
MDFGKVYGGGMMLFAKELFIYVFKYVVLGVVAICGVVVGAKYKKNKIEKNQTENDK